MEQSIDKHLFRATLPTVLIIDKSIKPSKNSYEDFLTEFVNCSQVFLKLSGGNQYIHVPQEKQNCKECDCHSINYDIDFKLFGPQRNLYATSNLTWKVYHPLDCITLPLPPQQKSGMDVSITNLLLRGISLKELETIASKKLPKFDRNQYSEEQDIQSILNTVSYDKNCLFFHTDYIFADIDCPVKAALASVESYLNECLINVFLYREKQVPTKDTFLAIIVQSKLCIAEWKDGCFVFSEALPLSLSKTFCDTYEFIGNEHKKRICI